MTTRLNDLDPSFRPPAWLRSGHLQTLVPTYFPGKLPADDADRHFVQLEDGDQLVLHRNPPRGDAGARCDTTPRAALLIHGLTGCHGSSYMRRAAGKLLDRGVHTFRLDMRGAGVSADHCRHMNHAGRSDDLLAATRRVCELCPDASITIVAFSLGGAMTLRMLGNHAGALPPQVANALVVSPPIDLAYCCEKIQQGVTRVYDRTMARWMYHQVERRRETSEAIRQLDTGVRPRSIKAFDAQFTAPLGGFASVDAYYARASAAQFLHEIRLPTRILAAKDDPVVPVEIFRGTADSDHLRLWMTDHGGHLGYLGAKTTDPDPWWLDWRIADFVTQTDHRVR